jgi:hypothetical protein
MIASLACAATALLFFIASGNSVALVLASLYCATVLININPFVRMDGYWLLSDLLGIPDLMEQNLRLTRWLVGRVIGRGAGSLPSVLRLRRGLRDCYAAYYVLFIAFAAYLSITFGEWYCRFMVLGYPRLVTEVLKAVIGGASLPSDGGVLLRLLAGTVPSMAVAGYAYRYCRKGFGWLPWRKRSQVIDQLPSEGGITSC